MAQASACVLSFYLTKVVIRVGRAPRPSGASIHLVTLRRFTKRPCLLAVAEPMYSRREAERWTGGTPVPLGLEAEGAFEGRNSSTVQPVLDGINSVGAGAAH